MVNDFVKLLSTNLVKKFFSNKKVGAGSSHKFHYSIKMLRNNIVLHSAFRIRIQGSSGSGFDEYGPKYCLHLHCSCFTICFLYQERTRFYGAEIICAIDYLHMRGIIYRDLKVW